MYKNNSRFDSKFNSCSLLQLACNLTGMKRVIVYYSYTNTLEYIQLKLTKIAPQLRCSHPFGNVLQRPAKPNC